MPPSPPLWPTTVEELNSRFAKANASSDLRHAGILVHILMKDVNAAAAPWSSVNKELSDRFECSLIYPQHTAVVHPYNGLIVRPAAARVLCSYASDGHTFDVVCGNESRGTCTPGCPVGRDAKGVDRTWWPHCRWPCGYAPSNLDAMLYNQRHNPQPGYGYNEIIVDAARWEAHLPFTVEAMFTHVNAPAWGRSALRDLRMAFVQHFQLDRRLAPPLLVFDPRQGDTPFRVLEGG